MNNQHHSNDISRREFLKIVGISTATTTAVLAGCGPKDSASGSLQAQGEVPTDKMTMRENPKTKEKVSLLGYGCMRWPTIIRKSKFPQNPKRSVRFSGKRTKRSVQKRKARNTQKAETKVL